MRAILIDGLAKTVTEIDVESEQGIAAVIGYSSIIADEIDTRNAVYFDEDCFLRGTEGRFVLDTLPPIAGNALVMGRAVGDQLVATELTLDEVLGRLKFS